MSKLLNNTDATWIIHIEFKCCVGESHHDTMQAGRRAMDQNYTCTHALIYAAVKERLT